MRSKGSIPSGILFDAEAQGCFKRMDSILETKHQKPGAHYISESGQRQPGCVAWYSDFILETQESISLYISCFSIFSMKPKTSITIEKENLLLLKETIIMASRAGYDIKTYDQVIKVAVAELQARIANKGLTL